MRLKFSDLFNGLGTEALAYGAGCKKFAGQDVEIRGWLAPAHDGSGQVLLVNAPGACPDCSPSPVAGLLLPGFILPGELKTKTAVIVRGRISYGFACDEKNRASFLRLENAQLCQEFSP